MPLYRIEQYEIHTMAYHIEAANEAEAIARLFDGDTDPGEPTPFVETAEDYGLPADSYPVIVRGLRKRGIRVGEVIPSIREIMFIDSRSRPKRGRSP